MTVAQRKIATILMIATAVTVGVSGSARTFGQEPITGQPPVLAGPPTPIESLDSGSTGEWSSRPVEIGDFCRPNYWIVSTERCQQQVGRCPAQCQLAYYHFPPGGCAYQTSCESLSAALQPGVPVCIFVHGSFVTWRSIQSDALKTYKWIKNAAPHLPMHFIVFHWPSESVSPVANPLDVAILGHRAEFNAFYLNQLLAQIPAENPISLLGHSHGSRLICSAMHLLGGGTVQGLALPPHYLHQQHRIRVVLAAAAVDHHWLNPGERYGCALHRPECLLNLRSRHDSSLVLYPLRRPFSHRALAVAGFTKKDRRQLQWLAGKISEWDVTPWVRTGHIWPNYHQHPHIACGITPYLLYADSVTVNDAAHAQTGQPRASGYNLIGR